MTRPWFGRFDAIMVKVLVFSVILCCMAGAVSGIVYLQDQSEISLQSYKEVKTIHRDYPELSQYIDNCLKDRKLNRAEYNKILKKKDEIDKESVLMSMVPC